MICKRPSISGRLIHFALLSLGFAAWLLPASALLPASTSDAQAATKLKVETIARGLDHPWGFDFLPDGRIIVSERAGNIRIVNQEGRISSPLKGVPRSDARGQGGMLDIQLSPNFAQDKLVYFSFAEPRGRGRNGTSVGRGRLILNGPETDRGGGRLENVEIIFRQKPSYRSSAHFGSRLVFARDGTLFITTGDRYSARDEAQNPANHLGKIIHINPDGSIPADNPRRTGGPKTRRWAPEVWSIGHRNVQGAALNPATGQLWTAEHGARGGDEINTPKAGRNYGWPVITYGRDYSGAKIGIGTKKAGMEQPVYYWDPSIAPSGAAFYTGDLFPQWKGNLFVGALKFRLLARLELKGGKVVKEERLLKRLRQRIRAVRQGPDGAIWLLTDSPVGRILRITPG